MMSTRESVTLVFGIVLGVLIRGAAEHPGSYLLKRALRGYTAPPPAAVDDDRDDAPWLPAKVGMVCR